MHQTPLPAEASLARTGSSAPPSAARRAAGVISLGLVMTLLSACAGEERTSDTEETAAASPAEEDGGDSPQDEESETEDDPSPEQTEETAAPESFEGNSGPMSLSGTDEGSVTGVAAEAYATDAPDPVADPVGSSSTEFRDSVYEAREDGRFQTGTVSGVSVEDAEMGNGLEITQVIRDFPSPRKAGLLSQGGEVVLLYVEPTRETETFPTMNKLFFLGPPGEERRNTLLLDAEMERADLRPYDVHGDDPEAGWIAFVVAERAEDYELGIVRPEIEATDAEDSEDYLEQKVWEFSLTAE